MTRVITYGTFDLFHEGHYRLLKRQKNWGLSHCRRDNREV